MTPIRLRQLGYILRPGLHQRHLFRIDHGEADQFLVTPDQVLRDVLRPRCELQRLQAEGREMSNGFGGAVFGNIRPATIPKRLRIAKLRGP